MIIFKVVGVLVLYLQAQLPSAKCKSSFSAQDVSRSDGLNTLFGENYQSDLQSLSLAFQSGNELQRFTDNQPLTAFEDHDDLQSRKLSVDLLETDKDGGHEGSEIGGEEDSSYIGSRKTNSKGEKPIIRSQEGGRDFKVEGIEAASKNGVLAQEEKAGNQDSSSARRMLLKARDALKSPNKNKNIWMMNQDEKPQTDQEHHEAITKMTLHNILLQPERKDPQLSITKVSSKDNISAKKDNLDAVKTADRLNGRIMQKRESFEEDKENMTGSGSADTPETASSGVEVSGQLKDHSTSTKIYHNFKVVKEVKSKGEPEFSGRDPLTVVLGASGSGESQYSGSGMAVSKRLQQQETATEEDSNSKVLGSHALDEESAMATTDPLKTYSNPTEETLKGEGESGSGRMSVDPLLLFQVRKIRMNVLKAEKQATKELDDVRKDFRFKMEDLEEDLKMVRKLTSNVHKKVGLTVNQALAMARQAKSNATNRLNMARRAATALNNIEKRLGVVHTRNTSRILRSRIPQFPNLNDVALYRQLLATDAILTKLDGAKTLAVYRAEKRFRNEEETGSSIAEEVDSLRDELASAEKELSDETEAEMEDEREAQEKIEEAMARNKLVARKTAFALMAIENYLQKLQSDEGKLKRLRFY